MFTVLPFQDRAESGNQKQMSQSRALANESSRMYSRLRASHTTNRSYITVADISESRERSHTARDGPLFSGVCLHQGLVSCIESCISDVHHLSVLAKQKLLLSFNAISISSGIHSGIASGGSWKCVTVWLFFFFL